MYKSATRFFNRPARPNPTGEYFLGEASQARADAWKHEQAEFEREQRERRERNRSQGYQTWGETYAPSSQAF